MPKDFDTTSKHAADCSKISASSAEWLAEAYSADVCQDLQEKLQRDPQFLSNVITDDEAQVHGYDP
jgi:hypothetical protein